MNTQVENYSLVVGQRHNQQFACCARRTGLVAGRSIVTYTRLLSLVVVALALVVDVAAAQESGLARGSQLLSQYKTDLQEALREGLNQGEVEAIAACRVQAPKIAKTLSRDDIRVGRTSHRLRNPANAPPDWVEPILQTYVASPSDREPRTVPLPQGRLGYVEPIVLQPLCVACHGEVLDSEVASRINELYPADRAVGFHVGELRGVFWIEFPVEN